MIKWKKRINLNDSRKLAKKFCNYFDIPLCDIFFVDRFLKKEKRGIYFASTPEPTILIYRPSINRIGILVHELTHHLEFNYYEFNDDYNEHGYNYQLAKRRSKKWCEGFISGTADWSKPLSAKQHNKDMEEFEL